MSTPRSAISTSWLSSERAQTPTAWLTQLNEAVIAFARGDPDRASELLVLIESVLDESGTELAPDDQYEVDHLRRGLTATVGGG
jgi:hypothetical protein